MSSTLQEKLAGLHRRIARVIRNASRLEEELDAIERELRELLGVLSKTGALSKTPDQPRCGPHRGRSRKTQEALDRFAQKGVASVRLRFRADESAMARIGDGRRFKLSPMLAELLRLLSARTPGPDHLVGWKAYEELALSLGKRFHRNVDKHALIQLISRLRQCLDAAKENPFLVQTSRRGARFALRAARTGTAKRAVTACDRL